MKRLSYLLLVGLVCSGFLALGADDVVQAKEIAIIWDTKSAMPQNVTMGFLPRLRELAPDIKVNFFRELKDFEEAKKVFHECESKMDGILFLRSSGAEYLGKIKPKVPCFIGASNNPVELGTIKNMNAPEGMVTGVTYYIPYAQRFDIILSLFPGTKSVALLVEKGHPSGPIEQAGTLAECKARGITYREVVASSLDELLQGTRSLGKVDLVILCNNRLVMDNVVSLLPITNPMGTPVFSYADRPVKAGAVAGIAADDRKLGAMLAESVVDVLVNGKPISQVPVKMDPSPKVSVNEPMMLSLGLKFPESIMANAAIVR
ncbi:MAG: ABC transporter substrate binding protein [Thermodesulfobacteriota bacterium]